MQIDALKTTAKAFRLFRSGTGGGSELVREGLGHVSDHMDALADIDSIMSESGKLPLAFDDDDDEDLLKELEEYELKTKAATERAVARICQRGLARSADRDTSGGQGQTAYNRRNAREACSNRNERCLKFYLNL